MTMAVIVACKNNFYIVADTLTTSGSTFTLNNQKVFWSEKHNIGLCIAGQANLISKNLGEHSIYVSHIVREFFKYIDYIDIIQIENLNTLLEEYVDNHYAAYNNYFKFQTPGTKHENDVSYFYGGFKNNEHGANTVAIYSHHKGVRTEGDSDSAVPYFSNYQEVVEDYINFALSDAPVDKPRKENLIALLDKFKDWVLMHCIPNSCTWINGEHPYSIGNDLHCVDFGAEGVNHLGIRYNGQVIKGDDGVQSLEVSVQKKISLPDYSLYETYADSILANEVAYSSADNEQVTRFIDNFPSEEETIKPITSISTSENDQLIQETIIQDTSFDTGRQILGNVEELT